MDVNSKESAEWSDLMRRNSELMAEKQYILDSHNADKERIRQLVFALDKANGTPCAQIRHQQDVENLGAKIERLLMAGNHIANWRSTRWPDYPLDGLTRDQQCESALRLLGAGCDYDMWCCWSAMMQVRDELAK